MFRTPSPLALLICISTNSWAQCSCLWAGPFTRVAADTDLIAAVTVLAGKGNSVDLQVEQILRGEDYRDQIRLWLNSGDLCRPSTDVFPSGTRWVMALDRVTEVPEDGFNPRTPNMSYGRIGDYSISSCGGYWLKLEENMVTGNLAEGARWEQNPKMSPVLLELVVDFVNGNLNEAALKEASKTDPELQRLKLETRSFLRQQGNPLLAPE